MDSREKIVRLYEKFREFPFVLDDATKDMTIETFYNILMSRANVFYEVGNELGLAVATNVRPRVDANIHMIFFDRKIKGREGVFTEILTDLALRAKLRRMTSIVSSDNSMMQRFLDRCGFVHEGTMRNASLRGGRYYDLEVYGILREELADGRPNV